MPYRALRFSGVPPLPPLDSGQLIGGRRRRDADEASVQQTKDTTKRTLPSKPGRGCTILPRLCSAATLPQRSVTAVLRAYTPECGSYRLVGGRAEGAGEA